MRGSPRLTCGDLHTYTASMYLCLTPEHPPAPDGATPQTIPHLVGGAGVVAHDLAQAPPVEGGLPVLIGEVSAALERVWRQQQSKPVSSHHHIGSPNMAASHETAAPDRCCCLPVLHTPLTRNPPVNARRHTVWLELTMRRQQRQLCSAHSSLFIPSAEHHFPIFHTKIPCSMFPPAPSLRVFLPRARVQQHRRRREQQHRCVPS